MRSCLITTVKLIVLVAIVQLFSSFNPTYRQVHVFSVKKAGVKVGSLTASSMSDGSITIYSLGSNTSVWIGTRVWVNHTLKCVYDKSKLVRADMNVSSSKGNFRSWIVWKGDHYDYEVNSYKHNKSGKLTSPVDFSLVKMYFQEPPASRKVALAENHAEIVKIANAGQHTFSAHVNDKPNVYYYSSGKLVKADLVSSSFEYMIERE